MSLIACALACLSTRAVHAQDWSSFNGDERAQKYSSAAQITPSNVSSLRPAWIFHTGDVSAGGGGGRPSKTSWSATPIVANGLIYLATPFYRVFALDPSTGRPRWVYDSHSPRLPLTQTLKTRGVAYWASEAPVPGLICQKIVYLGTMDGRLHALDADSGKLCPSFGDAGVLNVNQWNTVNPVFPLSLLQPPAVYKNTLILGWAGKDWTYQASPPGTVFGLDARTGALKWTFQVLPAELRGSIGTANVWAAMSVDPLNGLVYLPVSSPEPNFFGGGRTAPLPFATSITVLHAETGTLAWSRQLVRHDLWDFDTDSAPLLVDIDRPEGRVPALVQSSKQGLLYVLDRLTGDPVFPIKEVPVPASDVPGETAALTQPVPEIPKPTVDGRFPGISPLADLVSLGFCSRTYAKARDLGRFTPPSLEGSIAFPGTAGGVEWGGGAVDPQSGTYVVNSSNVAAIETLIPRAAYDVLKRRRRLPAEVYPQLGSPYAVRVRNFLNPLGMPCWKPPYGTLSAYDLKTGSLLWREPFGRVRKYGIDMPRAWGSPTVGGPIITASGLIFIGASMDRRVRALDLRSGRLLWSYLVDAPVVSNPASFVHQGRQFVVFTVGGNSLLDERVSDEVIAFALPSHPKVAAESLPSALHPLGGTSPH